MEKGQDKQRPSAGKRTHPPPLILCGRQGTRTPEKNNLSARIRISKRPVVPFRRGIAPPSPSQQEMPRYLKSNSAELLSVLAVEDISSSLMGGSRAHNLSPS